VEQDKLKYICIKCKREFGIDEIASFGPTNRKHWEKVPCYICLDCLEEIEGDE
jgi:hypothetical protein